MKPQSRPDVSIVVCTFRRPAWLRQCLESCISQRGLGAIAVELLVVDNCPMASGESVARSLEQTSEMTINYVHEPQRGISAARNAGLKHATGALIAFLDDDERASEHWLSALLQCKHDLAADAVFGPVQVEVNTAFQHAQFYGSFLSRRSSAPAGTRLMSSIAVPFWRRDRRLCPDLASCNVLFDPSSEPFARLRFDEALGRTGGEDTLFFTQAAARGAVMYWCDRALVTEQVSEDRLTERYVMGRAFRSGQLVSLVPMMLAERQPRLMLLSMLIGAAQMLRFGIVAVVAALRKDESSMVYSTNFAGAAGKVLWQRWFRTQRYGNIED